MNCLLRGTSSIKPDNKLLPIHAPSAPFCEEELDYVEQGPPPYSPLANGRFADCSTIGLTGSLNEHAVLVILYNSFPVFLWIPP